MKHARTWARVCADLTELEMSAERAGIALACTYSTAAEFEAAVIRARRGRGLAGTRFIAGMRVLLAATAVASVGLLAAMVRDLWH